MYLSVQPLPQRHRAFQVEQKVVESRRSLGQSAFLLHSAQIVQAAVRQVDVRLSFIRVRA
jgi:hypothetical protein